MWNHQNYTILIAYLIHAYIFHFYETLEILHKKPFTILCHFICTNISTNTLYLWLPDLGERSERKGTIGARSFPFVLYDHFQYMVGCCSEGRRVRKNLTGYLDRSCFLECYCLLFVFKATSGLNREPGLSGLSVPPLTASWTQQASSDLLWVLLNFMHYGSSGILCSWASQRLNVNGTAGARSPA